MSQHPVDALKDLGMPMTPECEAEMRRVCDEEVSVAEAVTMVGDYEAVQRLMEQLNSAPRIVWGEPPPRVITRVMDDGIKTKDGAA